MKYNTKNKSMKKLIMVTLITVITLPCIFAQKNNPAVNETAGVSTILWEKQHIDLGYIALNKPVTATYKFTNNSDKPVVVEEVNASCGCTAARHSDAPIAPGESSEIKVTYNAARAGVFQKSVRVKISGTDQVSVLNISGTVE